MLGALGAGGMGEVYRARDTRLGRDVALKVLPADVAGDPGPPPTLRARGAGGGGAQPPGVLALYDVGEAEGVVFIVTELLEGETLRARLGRGPVSCERVAEWGASAADALAAAHAAGIVHRDLKPENLFLTRDGRLKVLDFGLAKELAVTAGGSEDATLSAPTGAGIVLGTVGYLSPEQARGAPVDGRSDIFSLGCVLYETLTGHRAFGGKTAQDHIAAVLRDDPPDAASIRAEAPLGLTRVVQRCLAKEPEQRFQSASDLAFALRSFGSTSAAGVAPAVSAGRPARRGWLVALGLGLAGLAGLAAGYWLQAVLRGSRAGGAGPHARHEPGGEPRDLARREVRGVPRVRGRPHGRLGPVRGRRARGQPHGGTRPRDPEPGGDRRPRDLARRELHRGSRGAPGRSRMPSAGCGSSPRPSAARRESSSTGPLACAGPPTEAGSSTCGRTRRAAMRSSWHARTDGGARGGPSHAGAPLPRAGLVARRGLGLLQSRAHAQQRRPHRDLARTERRAAPPSGWWGPRAWRGIRC